MAIVDDLRFINGQWVDTFNSVFVYGTEENDLLQAYGGNDAINGYGGNDAIFDTHAYGGGNSGSDTVYAGEGNDLIVTSLDSINEYHGDSGLDTIDVAANSNGTFIDLAAGTAKDATTQVTSFLYSIENASGSAASDFIYGNAAGNVLDGKAGFDVLFGRDGNDQLRGGDSQDTLFGGNGNDVLRGDAGNDILKGEAGIDFMFGETGNDFLTGGAGLDQMTGGSGTDKFVFKALADSRNSGADRISDFRHLVDDMDVSAIDANAITGGNQAFRFVGSQAFNAAGQIRAVYNAAQNETVLLFNTDRDAAAEMTIQLDGHINVTALDFIL